MERVFQKANVYFKGKTHVLQRGSVRVAESLGCTDNALSEDDRDKHSYLFHDDQSDVVVPSVASVVR